MDFGRVFEILTDMDIIQAFMWSIVIGFFMFMWKWGGEWIAAMVRLREKRRPPEYHAKKYEQGVDEILEVYELCSNFQHEFRAGRLLLVKFHNGGGYPDGSNDCEIDVPYEVVDHPNGVIRNSYQAFRGYDKHYVEMIKTLHDPDERGVFYVVDDMPDCFLKDTYKANKIDCVHIKYITLLGNDLWFYSMQWNKHPVVKDKHFNINYHEYKMASNLFINEITNRIQPKQRDEDDKP